MTYERQDITEDFYAGDTKDIEVTIYDQDGQLKDLANSELTYALIYDDAKNPYTLFQKTSVGAIEIEITGTGKCVIHLLPGDTFSFNGTFRHQLHLVDENGYAGIVMSGKVQIFKSFARRSRNSGFEAYLSGTAS